ncbi:hypothetical protein ACFLYJ_00780 [Candidatus Cloacimonadota bacterium]
MKKQIVVFLILIISCTLSCKEFEYLSVGYSFETYANNDGLAAIFKDFNDHYAQTAQNVKSKLDPSRSSLGLILAGKLEVEEMSLGFSLLGHVYSSIAEGSDSVGVHYNKKVSVTHSGFNVNYAYYIIQSDAFRSGPSFSFNFEQFQTSIKDLLNKDIDKTTDTFYFSFSLRWPISIGGGKFNFDIVPYYQIPFYKMNLTKLNKSLNYGYYTNYSKDKMKFSPASAGILLILNFSV